jgi:hypothetical protein
MKTLMRVEKNIAFLCAYIRCTTESPNSKNGPRRRAVALPHSRRLCAAAGSLPPPLLDGRKSVPSTDHTNMCGSIFVTGYPRSGERPAPSRRRSRTLSQAVRGHGDAAPTRRIAPSRGARLGSGLTDSQGRLPAKVEYALRVITWVLACVHLRGA